MTISTTVCPPRREALAKMSDHFLTRVAAGDARNAPFARWELDRRTHETRRDALLSCAFRNPTAANTIQAGDVLSQGHTMRALVRAAHVLRGSGRVVLGVSYVDLVTGVPEEQVRELPVMDGRDMSLHLVTRDLAEVAPYAVEVPAIAALGPVTVR